MKTIALIGYGNLGIQIEALLKNASFADAKFLYFDDVAFEKKIEGAYPFAAYADEKFSEASFLICLGYRHLRKKQEIIHELKTKQRKLLTFVHHSAFISPDAIIGEGVVIYPMCNIDYKAVIGDGTLLNNSCIISHETQIGECCFLAPAVTLSGFVTLGDCSFIGSASVVSNGVEIGSACIIGIGSVVISDIPASKSAIGNPAQILDRKIVLR